MKTRTILREMLVTLLLLCRPAVWGQELIDSTPFGRMDGFELHGNGYFFWNDGELPDGELFPGRMGQIALRTSLGGRDLVVTSTRAHVALQSTHLDARFQSVARNDDYMFYFSDSFIHRRGIFGDNPPLVAFSGSFFNEVGSMLRDGSALYWNALGGGASANGEIRRKDVNGPSGGGDVVLGQGMGLVTKMKIITVVDEGGSASGHYLFMLNTLGQLWHIRLESLLDPTTGPATFYAGDITDFDARRESVTQVQGQFLRRIHSTKLYATTGAGLGSNRGTGKLLAFNLTSGGTFTEHDSNSREVQFTGVLLDDQRVFLTVTPLIEVSPNNWAYNLARSQLFRRDTPANRDILPSPWVFLVENVEARNLRTDGLWIYYAHAHQVWRIRNNAPGLQLDIGAVGLEAVQAVQDFNNSVPLVAGKPTLVRGYAQLLLNTSGRPKFRLTARLRASRNGEPLPGEAYAENHPRIDGSGDLLTLRSDLNRSFNFTLPIHWLNQPGPIRLEMMVNPTGTAAETSDAPFANNTAVATLNVVPARTPCLVFKTMSSANGNYDMTGFADIIERASALMPVSGFRTFISQGVVRKPVGFLGLGREAFKMPADADWALRWMTMAHAFSSDPDGCQDTHWVGTFPSSVPTFNGIGGARGVALSDYLPGIDIDFTFPRTAFDNTSCVRMDSGPGLMGMPWSSVRGGFTLAHELSHNYGRFHIDQRRSASGCSGGSPERPWHIFPGDPCNLGPTDRNLPTAPIGYDFRSNVLVLPNMAGDLMTYRDSRWMSPFTWNALVGAIPVPSGGGGGGAFVASSLDEPSGAPGEGVLMVQGIINPAAQTATLLPLFQLTAGTFNAAKVQESFDAAARLPANAPYRLRLLNAAGAVLDDRAIVPLASSDAEDGGAMLAFFQAVPHVAGATTLQVRFGSALLGDRVASANAPALALAAPQVELAQEALSMAWTASDPDGEPLLFTVQFSADDGVHWEALLLNDPARSFTIGTRQLRGGNACRLRVLATDGFRTTLAMTAPFTLPKHAPMMSISGVRAQQQLAYNADAVARAFAYDAEEGGLSPSSVRWTATGTETRTGTDAKFSLKGLAPGDYSLTATAADREGNPGSMTLPLKIRPLEILDGAAPQVDGVSGDESYSELTEVRLVPERGAPAARFVHSGGSLYIAFDGLPYSDSKATPANINFYINPDAVSTSAPQADEIGFGVTEDGVPARARGTGSGWTSEAPLGFEVKILRGPGSWSAEFHVPDSLLAGWNHAATLVAYFNYSTCLALPDGGCFSVAQTPVVWPKSGDVLNPQTWAAVSFGPLPLLTNRPPVAIASGPSVVSYTAAETVGLTGAASYDLDEDSLNFTWIQTGGPAVTLTGGDTATPSFTTPLLNSPATVTLELVVRDGALSSAAAPVTVLLAPAALPPDASTRKSPVTVNVDNGSAAIQLGWPGAPGDPAIIQASEDLKTWVNVATNNASYLGVLLHTELQAGRYSHRFYRAASAPTPTRSAPSELHFDGVNDSVEIPHAAALNTLPLTITAWIRTSQTTGRFPGIVTKCDGNSGTGYAIALDSGRLACFYLINVGNFLSAGASEGMPFVADGQWHHVVYVVTVSGASIYLDGSLVRAHGWTGSPSASSNPVELRFGAFFGGLGAFYRGDLDEVSVWNRALTEVEINQLIPGTLTGSEIGLLGYWNLDAGSGGSVADNSGHGHNGVLVNDPQWMGATAPLRPNPTAGTALRFDGVNDAVEVAHAPALNAFPLTIGAWVKTGQNSPGFVSVANKYIAGSGNGYSLHLHNGRLFAFYFPGDGFSSVYGTDPGLDGGFVADGQWHHVAFVVDAAGGRLFVDGTQVAFQPWAGSPGPCSATTPLRFGPYPIAGQTFFDGRMDEMTLWNRALGVSEINALMQFKPNGHETGLVGYWPFDDATGSTATDATGQGLNGVLQNDPLWVPSDAPIRP